MKQQNRNISQALRRKLEAGERQVRRYRVTPRKTQTAAKDTLRIIPLGGQNGIGEKNMIVLEYGDDAIVLDCGHSLGIDLPGINYVVPAVDYLQSIRHKLRGYVITHGHLDHIGGLIHTVPDCPAPIIGTEFTIGMVNAQFEKAQENGVQFQPETVVLDMDAHEQLKLGEFMVELIRVTHAIPESSAIMIETPVGRIINTGDFRLDPEPLDDKPSDVARLKQLGDEGVLLLMSESTNANKPGRTPTEHTLAESFNESIAKAKGRIFIAVFSSNMNRIQMIINAAAKQGRRVALDGRSMMATAELAVRLGKLKIPKGTLIVMRETTSLPDNKLVVICTGGQGEPGAAMSRMAAGEHQYIKLKQADTVMVSSTPIPGNEVSYQDIADSLATIGVKQYRHSTHEIDGCGPLHVSGHGNRDEHAEMIQLTRPEYLMPIYGGALYRRYHRDVGLQQGLRDGQILMVENGGIVEIDSSKKVHQVGQVTTGARLVDQTGHTVPELVVKDRMLLQNDGFVVVTVTVEKQTGRLLSSPDILTRGAISIRDNSKLMEAVRQDIRKLVMGRKISNPAAIELLKRELKDAVGVIVHAKCGVTPIIIPVVCTVASRVKKTETEAQALRRPLALKKLNAGQRTDDDFLASERASDV